MAYKFQLDDAILSGSLAQEGNIDIIDSGVLQLAGSTAIDASKNATLAAVSGSGNLSIAGTVSTSNAGFTVDADGDAVAKSLTANGLISGSGNFSMAGTLSVGNAGFTVDADGDAAMKSANLNSGGITNAGAIAGASTIAASGLANLDGGIEIDNGGNKFTVSTAGAVVAASSIAGTVLSGSSTATLFALNVGQGLMTVSAEGATEVASLDVVNGGITNAGAIAGVTTISGSGLAQFGQVRSDGGLTMQGTDIISAAKAIANVTSIDASGDLTVGTVTMTGFSVDNDGDVIGKSLVSTTSISASTSVAGQSAAFDGNVSGAVLSGSGIATLFGLNVAQSLTVSAAGLLTTPAGIVSSGLISGSTVDVGADLSVDGHTLLQGDIALSGAVDHTVVLANDSILFVDDATGKVRKDTFVDYAALLAGAGISANNGQLSVQGNTVTQGTDGGTLAEGYNFFTGTVNATTNLPAAPSVGDVVTIKAGNTTAGQNITVNAQGSHLIDGDATNIHLESPFAAVTLVYVVANDWRIV